MNRKKHLQCQIIYVTSLDRKDVVYVIVIFTLMNLIVHAVLQGLGQNLEVKDYGNNDDKLWIVFLEATLSGT